jgi:C1A family cysteine protease
MKRFGWVRDYPDARDKPFSARLAALGAPAVPDAASLRSFVAAVLDQLGLGSCVVNAGGQAIRISHVRQLSESMSVAQARLASMLPSRLWGYYLARAYDHETDLDQGTTLRNFYKAMAEWGFPPEELWPYSDAKGPDAPFRKNPKKVAYRYAFDQANSVAYHRVFEFGNSRIDAVKASIAAGFPVTFGTDVSGAFADGLFDPKVPLDAPCPTEPIAGGHAMTIVGYSPVGFEVVNSWGVGWGDSGYFLASNDFLLACEDLWSVETAPLYSEDPSP